MRFWDASAVVPLLIKEPTYPALSTLLESDSTLVVWWGTLVECTSALARREREGTLAAPDATSAFDRLHQLAERWAEILPSSAVRNLAQRILRTHTLRAADSLQLAAAIVASEHSPRSLEFVCLDAQLTNAASREGFLIPKLV